MAFMPESDSDYFDWLERHQEGFVLNVREHPGPNYAVLHRAGCRTISSKTARPGAYTERGYRKICADSEAQLIDWARTELHRTAPLATGCRCLR